VGIPKTDVVGILRAAVDRRDSRFTPPSAPEVVDLSGSDDVDDAPALSPVVTPDDGRRRADTELGDFREMSGGRAGWWHGGPAGSS